MNKLRALVGVMVLAVIVYSGLWYTSAFEAERQAAAQLSALRDTGLRVDHGKIKLSGFPYRIVLTIDGLQIRTRGSGLDFGATNVTLISHLWTPGHWIAEARNTQINAADSALIFQDGLVRGSYKRRGNGTAVIVLDTENTDDFVLENAFGLTDAAGLTGWQLFLRTNETTDDPANGLYEDRYLDFKMILSGNKGDFAAEGGIMGPKVTDWTTDQLANWRDAGGLLTIDTFALTNGDTALSGDASLTLDEAFRLLGSASLRFADREAATAALKAAGLSIDLPESPGTETPVSIMMQLGTLSLDGRTLMPLRPVVE